MTVTVNFEIDSLSGQPELFPGTDTFEQSVKHALQQVIDDVDTEALRWLCYNVYNIN